MEVHKKMKAVPTKLKREIWKRFYSLSSYDIVVLLALLVFVTLFYTFPMPELNWDAGRQAISGIFWHDVLGEVVLRGRFDSVEEFVTTYSKQYESDIFYYSVFWGLVLGFTFSSFGVSEGTFFFTVLLFALATILATYLLASRLYDKRIGVISSLFLASSQAFFSYTKSGEIDVPATAMVTITMLAFLKAEADRRWGYSVLAGVLIGLSFMTKPTTAILVMAFAFYLVLKYARTRCKKIGNLIISRRFEREKLREEVSSFKIVLVPALILGLIQTYIWVGSGEIYTWQSAFSGPPVTNFPWYMYLSWLFTEYFSPIIVSMFLIGFVFSLSRRKNEDVFLLTWFATFVLFAIPASNRLPRYLLPLVPCLSIIAAQGLVSLYDIAKQKLNIRRGKIPLRNLKMLFTLLTISGILNSAFIIPYSITSQPFSVLDFYNINESPMDEVAKFLAERAGVVLLMPENMGWPMVGLAPYSFPTLKFHILKYDRQRATNFYAYFILRDWLPMANETFLEALDLVSDIFGGKTVLVVISAHLNNESTRSQEYLESLAINVSDFPTYELWKAYQRIYNYMESHSELIPLIGVFRGGWLEIRVYQRIKGVF